MITKHSKKISEVLKEGDVIFYTINNSPQIYMGKVRQYKLGLGSNYYSLEQLNIIKVITKKEIKEVGFEINESI